MKKFNFLLLCLCLTGIVLGQKPLKYIKAQEAPERKADINDLKLTDKTFKDDGDVFWTETFGWENPDDPKGWTLPDGWLIGEELVEDLGYNWMWRNDTIRGYYTTLSPRTWFETIDDGFIVLPIDEYNYVDGVRTRNDCDAWIQTPPIDCSDKPSVVVKMHNYFRHCCSTSATLTMKVSNDNGVHWAEYDMNFGTLVNDYTLADWRNPEVNITNVAAGMSEVLIRFHWTGSRLYFWMIDDLKLAEAYHNELKLEDRWAFFNNGDELVEEGYINYIPLSQLNESFGSYSFRSGVLNTGMDDQTGVHLNIEVLKNGESVYNQNSPARDINTLERDTFNIVNEFLADDYGDYLIKFNNLMDLDDQVPDNNISELLFTVNDSSYMRSDKSRESTVGTSGWVGGKNSGDSYGNVFTLTSAVEASSITAYVYGIGGGAPSSDSDAIQFVLYKEDLEGDEDWVEHIVSEVYDLDSDAKNYWLTLPLELDGEAEFLEPGNYLVGCIVYGNGTPDTDLNHGEQDIRLGYDRSTYTPEIKTLMKFFGGENWSTDNGKLKMIGLNTIERGGPTIAEVELNVDMNEQIAGGLFNPASDFVDVSGTFNDWGGSEAFTDADGDGVYAITIPDVSIGDTIKYKYRINANEATAEADNREYEVRYWNVLDDVYVYSAASAIDDDNINDKILVYPNPTTGQFNLIVNNKKQSDLIIQIRDVQGQVVYDNKVKSVVNHTEIIDLNLPKGLYFLSVNSGSYMKINKVVIH